MSSEGNRVALIVACNRYSDPKLKELKAPSQDAERFARILEDPKIGGFKVTTVIDEPHWVINQKLEEFLRSCSKKDTLLLYFSCHGVRDEDGQLHFATVTTNQKLLFSTGVQSNYVNNMLDRCNARQKLILLDCCYSGSFEKGSITKSDDTQVNVADSLGRGKVVITASDEIQYAFASNDKVEDRGIGGSYFTNGLIKGLENGEADVDNDGEITYNELYDYVHDYVKSITPNQTPSLYARGVQGNFVVFKNIRDNLGSVKGPQAQTAVKEDTTTTQIEHDSFFKFIQEARVFLEQEQYDKAIKKFDGILALSEGHIEALNGKGVALCNQEKYEEALECFKEVLKIKPKHPEANTYVKIITPRIGKEHNPEVKPSYENTKDEAALQKHTEEKVIKALNQSTQIPTELIKKGDEFLEKRLYQDAIHCYEQALKIEPRSELAWYKKGGALDAKGDYEKALSCFEEAFRINPSSQLYSNNIRIELEKLTPSFDQQAFQASVVSRAPPKDQAVTYYIEGNTLEKSGHYKEAIERYEKALEIDPLYKSAWDSKRNALGKMGQTSASQVSHESVPSADPRNPYNDPTLPYYNPNLGKKKESNLYIKKPAQKYHNKHKTRVGSKTPSTRDATAWNEKGLVLSRRGRYEEAIRLYDKALVVFPNDFNVWQNKGYALYGLGKYEEAIKCHNKVFEIDPSYYYVWHDIGLALYGLGKYEEAIKCHNKVLEKDDSDVESWSNKGLALSSLGKYEEAIKCHNKALELDPNDPYSMYDKGLTLDKMGRKKDANECYKKARELGYKD